MTQGAPLVQLGAMKTLSSHAGLPGAGASSTAVREPVAEPKDLRVFESPPPRPAALTNDYTCPMDPEVHQDQPGACPKCGMALEASLPTVGATRVEYTCPMHPEIVRSEPGACPICRMALEPRTVAAMEDANPELVDMTRRFWISIVLTIPVIALGMSDVDSRAALATFVVYARGRLDRIHLGDAGGVVGRLAVFSSVAGLRS